VGQGDLVHASGTFPKGTEGWPPLRARVEDAFARMGLPPPAFEDLRTQKSRFPC
jgi:hypothetical protein